MSKELINFESFNADFGLVLAENEMFKESTKHGKKCITELKDRLIEHVSWLEKVNKQVTDDLCTIFRTFAS